MFDNTKLDVPEFIGWLFLSIVKLFDPKVPLASIIVTSSPVDGEAGSVIVIGLAVVFASICAPATVV